MWNPVVEATVSRLFGSLAQVPEPVGLLCENIVTFEVDPLQLAGELERTFTPDHPAQWALDYLLGGHREPSQCFDPALRFVNMLEPGATPETTRLRFPVNHLAGRQPQLRSQHSVLRHYRSIPNEGDVVVSMMLAGILSANGVSPNGLAAGDARVRAWLGEQVSFDPSVVRIERSDYSRTRETAEDFRAVAGVAAEHVYDNPALRERRFGEQLEGRTGAVDIYRQVWDQDVGNPYGTERTIEGIAEGPIRVMVESIASVQFRATQAVLEADRRHPPRSHIIHVTHGDVGQILDAGFRGMPLADHKEVPYLENGELRTLFRPDMG